MRPLLLSVLAVMLCVSAGLAETPWVGEEQIGPLRLDMTPAQVVRALGRPPHATKEIFQPADATYIQSWVYKRRGLSLQFSASRAGGPTAVSSIAVSAPCTMSTARGIHIGSTEAAVRKAYAKEIEPEQGDASHIVAFSLSVYIELNFTMKQGKVVSIYFGPGPE